MQLHRKYVTEDYGNRRYRHSDAAGSQRGREPDRCGTLEAVDEEDSEEPASAQHSSRIPRTRAPASLFANVMTGTKAHKVVSPLQATHEIREYRGDHRSQR
jgi:hypothetical protein